MAHQYSDDVIEWVYPKRPLHLLNWWKEIDQLCKVATPVPNSQFHRDWINTPHEFLLAIIDGELAGIVHMEEKRHSAVVHIVVNPDFQRSNLSQLMAVRTLKLIFDDWKKGKVFCDIGVRNKVAQHLAASVGFKRQAVYNRRIKYKLSWHDYRQGLGRAHT